MNRALDNDDLFMLEALALAGKGAGKVSPNPMVGAVITRNGKVLARGYHKRFGGPHAEVEAIRSAGTKLRGATLYTNLEPCVHFGKTPPCVDAIMEAGIKEVVIGMMDPNPLVAGKGIRQLRRAGIRVKEGVLETEARKLNEAFIKHIGTGLPFVTLKIAQTLDGKIADPDRRARWITNGTSRALVHALRARTDAVLVGARTVELDDPRLTVRRVPGRNPVRVILDGRFSVSPGASVFKKSGGARIVLFVGKKALARNLRKKRSLIAKGVQIIDLPARRDGIISLRSVLYRLGAEGITSLMVEGGAETLQQFLQGNYGDKLLLFIAPKIYGRGLNSFDGYTGRIRRLRDTSIRSLDGDFLITGYLH